MTPEYQYLLPDEIEPLIAVAKLTPKSFAKQIRLRNGPDGLEGMLDAGDWGHGGTIGCPHCMACANDGCIDCGFELAYEDESNQIKKCTLYQFAGRGVVDSGVKYAAFSERIRPYTFDSPEAITIARKFLRAHSVDFAAMIEKYGIDDTKEDES